MPRFLVPSINSGRPLPDVAQNSHGMERFRRMHNEVITSDGNVGSVRYVPLDAGLSDWRSLSAGVLTLYQPLHAEACSSEFMD